MQHLEQQQKQHVQGKQQRIQNVLNSWDGGRETVKPQHMMAGMKGGVEVDRR
jgi:hypothetical protein